MFACKRNACRSQMAEGFAKQLAQGKLQVESAGLEAGGLNPTAVAVMREAGVDLSGQRSKRLSEFNPEDLQRGDFPLRVRGEFARGLDAAAGVPGLVY